jgi:hypothetical protein
MIIYFGKINLNSSHIYQVYNKKLDIRDILQTLHTLFVDGIVFEKEEVFRVDTEVRIETTTYKVSVQEKTDDFIRGYVYKDSVIYFKRFDEQEKKLKTRSINNTEGVEFYFDTFSEIVGYHTALRLGHKEFLEAFEGLINSSLANDKNGYNFTVNQYTHGMNIKEIEKELKEIPSIQKLKIRLQPPNPDGDELRALQNNAGSKMKKFEEANIATKSVILTSASRQGLNIESTEIKDQLKEVNSIHNQINAHVSTKNGYAEVEAIDKYGEKYSTADKKAVKREINNVIEFKDACQSVILKKKMRGDKHV